MSDPNCVFCKIATRTIAADEVARDDRAVAFRDLNPQAPHHVLVIPTAHATHLSEFTAEQPAADLAHLFALAAKIGARLGRDGYRLVVNEGASAGQSVFHLHVHVLAGRAMQWPPG
jgi:histidine triad (HIT) family protein